MNITAEVIDKFFTGTCSAEEKEEVARYFEEHPSEADKYLPETDWNHNSRWDLPIEAHVSERMFDKIHSILAEKQLRRKAFFYKISSVAAAVLLLLVSVYYFEHKSLIPHVAIVQAPKEIIQNNTGNTIENIILPDSTIVELYPQSTISYLRNFEPLARNIHLKGEAVFKVYKDAHRPFTVYSEQISTTALGTRFRVKTSVKEISVTLYEGKVLVKKADDDVKELNTRNSNFTAGNSNAPASSSEHKRYYLNTGNEIVYNIEKNQFLPITNFLMPINQKPSLFVSKSETTAPSSSIIMDNISMSSALDMLAQKFDVQIEYSPVDVQDINIIATVNPKQSVEHILKDIASMNNLSITKVDSQRFIITKITK